MKIVSINVYKGLYSQYYHILKLMSDRKLSVLCVIEPKLNKKDHVPEFESFDTFVVDKTKMIVYVRRNVGLTCTPMWQGMPCFVVKGNQITISFAYSEFTKATMEGSRKLTKKDRLDLIKKTYDEIFRTSHSRVLHMGDFNFDYLKREECTYVKQFLNYFKKHNCTNVVEGVTRFPQIRGQESSQLDYCWIRNLTGRLDQFLFSDSDHMGLLFEVPSNETVRNEPHLRTLYKETSEMKEFLDTVRVDAEDNFNDEMNKPMEKNFDELLCYMKRMRDTMRVEKRHCPLDVPWWNKKLAILQRLIRKERNLVVKKLMHKDYLYWFNRYHREWVRKTITKKKHPFPKSKGETLSRLVVEEEEITDTEGLATAMRDAYIDKVEKNFEESDPHWEGIIEAVKNYVASGENENIETDEEGIASKWDIPIPNERDIEKVIDSLKPKTSVGATDVSYMMIRAAKKNILTKLTIIARQSLLFGKMADIWHKIIGIAVHKKGRDASKTNSFRIVALQDNLLKVIGLYVCNFITWKFEHMSLFADFVIGFRKGLSTDDYTFKLIEMINEAKYSKMALGAASSDLKSAYDLTASDYVLDVLAALGAGPRLRNWFKALYGTKTLQVRLNGFVSKPKEIKANLLQGDPSSPILFNVALFPIKFFVSTRILQYADDIHLTAKAKDAEKVKEDLLKYYNEYNEFVKATGMVSEDDKLEFKIWGKGSTKKESNSLEFNGKTLSMKPSMRILGLHLNSRLDFQEDVDEMEVRVRQRAGMIRIQGKHLPMKHRMTLYKGWINGKINFGMKIYLPFLTKERLNQMKEATNQGFRAAAGMMRRSRQCVTEVRSKYECAGFVQIARDSLEKHAFKIMKKLQEVDKKSKNYTRSISIGKMKKYANLHVKSLERFYREFVNENKLFEFKSLKELMKFQKKRLKEEFESRAHLIVQKGDGRVISFERTPCKLSNQNKHTCNKVKRKKKIMSSQNQNPSPSSASEELENRPPNNQQQDIIDLDMEVEGNGKYSPQNVGGEN